MSLNRPVSTAMVISFFGHALLLGAPGITMPSKLEENVKTEEVIVRFDMEKPELLPQIETIGEAKKAEKSEEEANSKQQENEPEEIAESVEPEQKVEVVEVPAEDVPKSIKTTQTDDESMLRYQDAIKQRIEAARRYPVWAKNQGIEGVVHVSFIVYRNGTIHGTQMTASSGSKILDEEAIATVNRAAPFPPCPENLHSIFVRIDVAVVFSLKG